MERQRLVLKNEVSLRGHQTLHGPCHSQGYQDPFPWAHPGKSAHCAVVAKFAKVKYSKQMEVVFEMCFVPKYEFVSRNTVRVHIAIEIAVQIDLGKSQFKNEFEKKKKY